MSWKDPVVWSQGMFLQPHHFQQEARYVERLVDERAQCGSPYLWGFAELALDDALLALGRVALARARGVMPDGTPFSVPALDLAPQPLQVRVDVKPQRVYLAVPLQREGAAVVDFGQEVADPLARRTATTEEVRDHGRAFDEPASIQIGTLRLQLLLEEDLTDAYAALAVAQVLECRSDRMVVLDRHHIAPSTRVDASAELASHARLIHGLIVQRAQELAGRMGQLSHGVSELVHFLMLQSLNGAEPVFGQFARSPSIHPFDLYLECIRLCGEFSTFVTARRRPPELPAYRHEDPRVCFGPVIDELRQLLAVVLDQNAIQIELVDRSHGVRTALVPDLSLVRQAQFVLAVHAQLPPEQLRARFSAQSKVGPVERIRDLVNLQLPGIGLLQLPVAPRQLPFHAGHFYFELERGTDLWKQFERSGNLALHVAGEFPGLELQLWAIRS